MFAPLTERFVNAVGDGDRAVKEKYADQVWELLQRSYQKIGGIKGSGFENKQSMIENIPMWKMVVQSGVVRAVILYKDKGGRKSVAMGSDGSDYAKKHLPSIISADITRSFGEKSKAALGAVLKIIPWDIIQHYIKTPEQAQKVLGKATIPIKFVDKSEWPEDAQATIAKFPHLIDYGYLRSLKGKMAFKVLIGSPGNEIK
ncbi:hypothetical protein NVP1081O_262 [Vibrio phage 1.081.O._10N.286.52.C2]|nr:hypothetical protein NVP1081O_262 [Vibrio phage 1.081.O._10N.286.52.C2]